MFREVGTIEGGTIKNTKLNQGENYRVFKNVNIRFWSYYHL
jgi:hypothetical protein